LAFVQLGSVLVLAASLPVSCSPEFWIPGPRDLIFVRVSSVGVFGLVLEPPYQRLDCSYFS
jgi:hypothetical protein